MRTNVVLDDRLKDLSELAGKIQLRPDYDHKTLRDLKLDEADALARNISSCPPESIS